MKNLENYGVQELDAKEVVNLDGGTEIHEGQCIGGDLGGSSGGTMYGALLRFLAWSPF